MSGNRDRHLMLVVPGLLGPVIANGTRPIKAARQLCEGLSLPAIERFFSRSTPISWLSHEPGLAAVLFDCFGVAREESDWPVAAVTRRLDGAGEDGRWWLRADPVHLRASMGGLTLLDSTALHVDAGEAEALTADINAQMDDPGFRLQALAPMRWYLGCDEAPQLVTRAPWEVSGSPIGEHLPRGDDAGRWRARINDVQMILHTSAVNRAREGRGEPAINSLWLWGGGGTPRVPAASWQGVWSDNALVAGLALLAQARADTLPRDAAAWLARAATPGDHLLVFSAAYEPVRRCDIEAWRSMVSGFEECWMAPLLEALLHGRVHSLRVRSAEGCDFRLQRGQLRRWWRRAKPFARIMSESDLSHLQQEVL